MMIVEIREGGIDHLGFIPSFLVENDTRPVKEQFNERYAHGGGWHHQEGFTVRDDTSLEYPGDPPLKLHAIIVFRGEIIGIYDYGYVSVTDKNKKIEVCRMD